jgi:hypothetical protein
VPRAAQVPSTGLHQRLRLHLRRHAQRCRACVASHAVGIACAGRQARWRWLAAAAVAGADVQDGRACGAAPGRLRPGQGARWHGRAASRCAGRAAGAPADPRRRRVEAGVARHACRACGAVCSSTKAPSRRAAASRQRGRPPKSSRTTSSTACCTTAWPTCPAACRAMCRAHRPARRTARHGRA